MDDKKLNNVPASQNPMSNEVYYNGGYYNGQYYGNVYYSRQEQVEAVRYERAMNRDILKSRLRQEEQQNKQWQKVQSLYIMECSEGIILYVKNALNTILRKQKLFDCQVTDMICYVREGTDILEWQIAIKRGDEEVQSKLYPLDTLTSISKLKKTILGKYDCTVSSADKRAGWNWMQQKLLNLFEKAPQVMLPSLAGWFQHGKNWHFWFHSDETTLLENEVISRFKTNDFPDMAVEEILEDSLDFYGKIKNIEDFGILQIFRLSAFLARLVTDSLPPMGLVLVGNNAVNIARTFLRTMDSGSGNYELVNLDSDSMVRIEKCVLCLQDTPFIIVSSNLRSKSSRNRLEKIRGWIESGYIEGKKNTIPFIFCLREYSPQYLPDESIIIYTDDLHIVDKPIVFDKIQNFIISKIESSGTFWIDKLRKEYRKEKEKLPEMESESILTIGKVVVSIVMKMLDVDNVEKKHLQMMFYLALKKIEKQFSMNQSVLTERFQNGICELFENCKLSAISIKEESSEWKRKLVYYDDDYYFFTKDVLETICQNLSLDRTSLLLIKHELIEKGMVKQYRSTGNRQTELNVEIFVGESSERKKVFAIKRLLWDAIGGIALYERGEQ